MDTSSNSNEQHSLDSNHDQTECVIKLVTVKRLHRPEVTPSGLQDAEMKQPLINSFRPMATTNDKLNWTTAVRARISRVKERAELYSPPQPYPEKSPASSVQEVIMNNI